jgi:hypothetical protein
MLWIIRYVTERDPAASAKMDELLAGSRYGGGVRVSVS